MTGDRLKRGKKREGNIWRLQSKTVSSFFILYYVYSQCEVKFSYSRPENHADVSTVHKCCSVCRTCHRAAVKKSSTHKDFKIRSSWKRGANNSIKLL